MSTSAVPSHVGGAAALVMHPILEDLFDALQHSGVRWCLLRVPENLVAPPGDIDLLLDTSDISTAQQVFRRLEYVEVPGSLYGRHFVRFHIESAQWFWVHVVDKLAFGPFYALCSEAEDECLARCRVEGRLRTLCPSDAFWAILLHCLLDKGEIPARHREMLRHYLAQADAEGPLALFTARVLPLGWSLSRVLQTVRNCSWAELEGISPAFTACAQKRQRLGKIRLLTLRVRHWLDRAWHLLPRRGLSVALLGPDGAGKTTLAEGIQGSFVFPVRVLYMGLSGGRLHTIDRLRIPGLVIFGRVLVHWLRYFNAWHHQLCGRLVVFDRYVFDAVAPHPERLNSLRRASRWIDGHVIPAPDLVLVLSAPGEIMYARKGEYNAEQLEDWRQHFLALQQRIPRLEVVDTTRSREAVRTEAIEHIWRRYAARWRAK